MAWSTCDTVAECGGQILGKPADEDHARAMLRTLSGREHRVLSGLCLWEFPHGEPAVQRSGHTTAHGPAHGRAMARLPRRRTWEGKAGAFGYQDGIDWVHVIEGSESNVVGLPMELLAKMLEADSGAPTAMTDNRNASGERGEGRGERVCKDSESLLPTAICPSPCLPVSPVSLSLSPLSPLPSPLRRAGDRRRTRRGRGGAGRGTARCADRAADQQSRHHCADELQSGDRRGGQRPVRPRNRCPRRRHGAGDRRDGHPVPHAQSQQGPRHARPPRQADKLAYQREIRANSRRATGVGPAGRDGRGSCWWRVPSPPAPLPAGEGRGARPCPPPNGEGRTALTPGPSPARRGESGRRADGKRHGLSRPGSRALRRDVHARAAAPRRSDQAGRPDRRAGRRRR